MIEWDHKWRDPNMESRKRHAIERPLENHVIGTIHDLTVANTKIRSLLDPDFRLTINEVLTIARQGQYLRNYGGSAATVSARAGRGWFRRRDFLVHQVVHGKYKLYVLWGYPLQVKKYLGIDISVTSKWHAVCLPFVLGWDYVSPSPIVPVTFI